MSARRWYEKDAIEKWGRIVLLVWTVVFVGPSYIGDMLEEPTAWHVTLVVVWVFAVAVLAYFTVRERFFHRDVPPPRVTPDTVPAADVTVAVASTTTRVAAVRKLREVHPGLGLGDAANLVDRSN